MVCTWITTSGTSPTDRIPGPLYSSSADWLMASHDGGVTWQRQPLPVPELLTGRILFFDPMHGVVIGDLNGHTAVASTSDGGATWIVHNAPDGVLVPPTFVDTAHGWTVAWPESDAGAQLFRTDDGGVSWTVVPTTSLLAGGSISQIYFVDQLVGFADHDDEVLRTTDGGLTWSVLATTT
jgi:photosystem II stability/assembly factor-like uncharacterized protein